MYPFFAKDGSATAFFDEPNPAGPGILYYQTVSAGRRFEKHSLEVRIPSFLVALLDFILFTLALSYAGTTRRFSSCRT